ncbi:MAG: hypothetical protein QM537_09600 [Candidatus Symbiobacter sp.]|nr:hypothetical protein [Candidatus Symbiobacter sp.]
MSATPPPKSRPDQEPNLSNPPALALASRRRGLGFGLLLFEILLLICGQFLFQKAASSLPILPGFGAIHSVSDLGPVLWAWGELILTPAFIGALMFYGGAVLTWMAALQILPIAQAMPVLALVFVLVPLLSFLPAGLVPPWGLLVGVGLVASSIIVIASDSRPRPPGHRPAEEN